MALIEITKDAKGQFRFRVKANNGEIVAVSESYKAKPKAMAGINSLKSAIKSAKIVDLTVAAKPAAKKVAKKAAKPKAKVAAKSTAKPDAKPAAKPKAKKSVAAKPAPVVSAPSPAVEAPPAMPAPTDNVSSN